MSPRYFAGLCLPVLSLLFTLCIAGCGSEYGATVHGIATLDGNPLTNGGVQFHPTGDAPTAYARLAEGGAYELETGSEAGIVPGKYKVTVMSTEPPPANLPPGQAPPIGKRLTPEKYGKYETTPFEFEVVAGDNTIDLKLTSK